MDNKWLKVSEMDMGTKLRTVLAVATSLNTALMATDLTGFNNAAADFAYKIVSIILNFVIVAIVTYMNNDYTKGASIGTVAGRIYNIDPEATIAIGDGGEEDEDEEAEAGDEIIEEGE